MAATVASRLAGAITTCRNAGCAIDCNVWTHTITPAATGASHAMRAAALSTI